MFDLKTRKEFDPSSSCSVMITITVIMTSIVIIKYASNTKINITMLIYLSLINVSWDKRRFSTAIEALPPTATVPQAFCLSVA